MGNTFFTQQKPQEKIPDAIIKKAKRALFVATCDDLNISSVTTCTEDREYIHVGVAEMGKSDLPSHFLYTCPDSGRVYSVPVKVWEEGKVMAQKKGP